MDKEKFYVERAEAAWEGRQKVRVAEVEMPLPLQQVKQAAWELGFYAGSEWARRWFGEGEKE